MHSIRVYEMPACKMVSSGKGMFGEERFDRFEKWFSSQKPGLFPKNFLYWAGDGFVWLYMLEDGMTVPQELEVVDFPGGLYAVATDTDQKTDKQQMDTEVGRFLAQNGFVHDAARTELGNIITSPLAQKIMGYAQMDYYYPIKAKE